MDQPSVPVSPGQASPVPPPATDARRRLPREPYPGLRPFLDFEAALLFGRERQVREVIDRLRETQFVAVLGGSGSGKSSLIHAGVTPELRSFGIPGAGDLWLSMVCTPGTNVSPADSLARRHSPITRLARRFGTLLRSRGSDEADALRVLEIAEVFRQESGFSRLLNTYGEELEVPPGPDPAEARVLFVLDQFEELFHPTNQGVEDVRLLVERVLDHFFNPHPHGYIVITMRTEQLDACATYLELPDAINKSSYLVRRLDEEELRLAITGPAQRFLRLVARSSPEPERLPAQVNFEPAVVDRLLADTLAIVHDPDHLPLLQHLLARLWEAALEREEMDVPVPSHITEIDLVRAVAAGKPGDEEPLAPGINVLRMCLQNWPESIYQWQDAARRLQLDALFKQLAFKDPNTGRYSQQRIDVDVAALALGEGKTAADLRALIAEGFLGSVDYLFWDNEDLSRVTLKVSHESFIRGWQRFRQLIDAESAHFDAFVGVMRQCADWQASQGHAEYLLESRDLRHLRDADIVAQLADPKKRASWFRFLLLDREGPRLAALEPVVDNFLATSLQRQQDRLDGETRTRKIWLWVAAVGLAAVPLFVFSLFIQLPVTERAQYLFDAGNRANRAALTPDYASVGAASGSLASLLRAAELIDDARTGQGGRWSRFSQVLMDHLGFIPPVGRQDAFLKGVAAQSEPPVNGKLRQLLSAAVWHAGPKPETAAEGLLLEPPVLNEGILCSVPDGVTGALQPKTGQLYHVPVQNGSQVVQRRAIFMPGTGGQRDTGIVLHSATFDAITSQCIAGKIVLSIPLFINPYVVFDAGLRYFFYSADGENVEVPSVTLLELDWDRADDGTPRVVQRETLSVVTDRRVVGWVRQAAGPSRLAPVPTWRQPAGRAVEVTGQPWRLVAGAAQRLQAEPGDARLAALELAPDGSVCRALPTGWTPQNGFVAKMFETRAHCFSISRGNGGNDPNAPGSGQAAAPREEVMVSVFDKPKRDALAAMARNPPAPIAAMRRFARVTPESQHWYVGTSGEYLGWLALRGPDANGRDRLIGAPWSTCALWRLGQALLFRNPVPSAPPQPAGLAPVKAADDSGPEQDGVCALD